MIKAEFVLTVDDYFEWTEAVRTPHRGRTPVIAFSGPPLITLGFILLRWFPQITTIALATFLAGLMTTLLSVPLWFSSRGKPAKAKRKEEESIFARFFREQRIFQASDEDWKYACGTREDSRRWSDLTGFRRSGQTFVLVEPFATYPLPVSALGDDQVNMLERLARKGISSETLFSIVALARPADYVLALMRHNWFKRTARTLFLYGLGLLWSLMAGALLLEGLSLQGLDPLLLVCVCIPPLLEAAHHRSQYWSFWKRSFHNAEIMKDAICFNQNTLRSVSECRKIRYEWIKEVVETKRFMMLYLAGNRFYILPKVDWSSEQAAQLRQMLTFRSDSIQPT